MLEIINTIGLFTSPIIAIGITRWWDAKTKKRDQKENVLQNFLTGWGRPSDPIFTFAMRQIPITFANNEKVLQAYKDWVSSTSAATDRDLNDTEIAIMNKKQRILLNEILRDLDFSTLTADDLSDYISRGLAERDMLLTNALRSLPSIAYSADQSAKAATQIAGLQPLETDLPKVDRKS